MAYTLAHGHTSVATASGLDVLAGLWLVAAPFILGYSGVAMTNDIIVGLAIAVLAASRLVGNGYKVAWPSWVNVILGAWLLLAPVTLGYTTLPAAFWNDIIMGIVVIALAAISAVSTPSEERIT